MHSIFSNVQEYINNQQIYNSNGLYSHKSYTSNNFKAAISEYKGVLLVKDVAMDRILRILLTPYLIRFFTRRMELLKRPDGFILYVKLGVDFLPTSELLDPNMKVRLRLIRARPTFYMISDNANVSLGIVDCSLYPRRIAFKDDYHKKRMDLLASRRKIFGDFGKNIHHTGEAKPILSRKFFQQCSDSSSRDCKEHKLCLHWFFY